jgi:Cytochrome P460
MKRQRIPTRVIVVGVVAVGLAVLGGRAITAQDTTDDKYTVQVPGGLAFSEFRGYERWQVVSISHTGDQVMAVILANPLMIDAYKAGIPGNGQPFPDGSQMAKVHWVPKKLDTFPTATVPGTLHDVDFMVKNSQRFADSGGWGWGAFKYNSASGKFTPADMTDMPPQGNDAKCGLGCHTIVKGRDYVFTEYGRR